MAEEETVNGTAVCPKSPGGMVDLSGQGLQKLSPTLHFSADIHTLILDKNQIIKLEHLEKCRNLTQLSVANNRLVRMMGVAKLTHLRVLNLPHNSIGYVEGLKDLVHLEWINLAGNNLKVIDQINNCSCLQHLDLSDNNLSQIGDLSKLMSLKTLLLHGNNITSLRTASSSLPLSLNILSLAENEIRDLNEVSYLAGLADMEQLSIMNNPCVMATPSIPGFDYRPYIVSWCLNLKVLDGYIVSQKESLKAEWLYSQGKGRSYRPGQHVPLVQYLASVCPLTSVPGLQTEEDAKLEKILSKQRLHQRQLMHQVRSEGHFSSTPNKRPSPSSEYPSPTRTPQRSQENGPAIRVDTWLAANSAENHSYVKRNSCPGSGQSGISHYSNMYLEDIQTDEDKLNCSLLSSESTFMPVAPGLSPVSPSVERIPGMPSEVEANETVMEFHKDEVVTVSTVSKEKLILTEVDKGKKDDTLSSVHPVISIGNSTPSNINNLSSSSVGFESTQPINNTDTSKVFSLLEQDEDVLNRMNKAATKLQSYWRGFYTRKNHPKVREVHYEIRISRMQDHIVFLSEEVARLKREKEEERIQRLVQEEAVRYLWEQIQTIQQWQTMVNKQMSNNSHFGGVTSTQSLPDIPACSSEVLEATSSSIIINPEILDRKSSPEFPDSGFHSILAEEKLNSSEKEPSEGSGSSELSLETVKHSNNKISDCPTEQGVIAEEEHENSKDSSNSDQDNSLLQQYLQSLEQREEADESTTYIEREEETRLESVNCSENSDCISSSVPQHDDCKQDSSHMSNGCIPTSDEACKVQKTCDGCSEVPQVDLVI
ncbi:centrosomal protein of 97 kDa [Discoglossus pictus]